MKKPQSLPAAVERAGTGAVLWLDAKPGLQSHGNFLRLNGPRTLLKKHRDGVGGRNGTLYD